MCANAQANGFDAVTIAAVTIAAVAQSAGVFRQTVYSNFCTREGLVSQAVAGLAMEVLGDIRARLDQTRTPFDDGMTERAAPLVRGLLSPLVERHSWPAEQIGDLAAISLRPALSVVLFDDPHVHTG